MRKFFGWILCHVIHDHDWTCKAEQGIDPSEAEVKAGVAGFWNYATMYCKRCGKVYIP